MAKKKSAKRKTAKKKAKAPAVDPAAPQDTDPAEPLPPPIEEIETPIPLPPAEKDPLEPKSPLKSRTFWTGMMVSLLGFLGVIQAIPSVANNAMLSNLLLMAVGIVMIGLRQLTRQPVNPVFNIPHMGGGGHQPLPAPLPPYPQPQPQPHPLPPADQSGGSWNGWRDNPSTRAN
jgi:hypothetical protein